MLRILLCLLLAAFAPACNEASKSNIIETNPPYLFRIPPAQLPGRESVRRAIDLQVDENLVLCDESGNSLEIVTWIDPTLLLRIRKNGRVEVKGRNDSTWITIGQLQIVELPDPLCNIDAVDRDAFIREHIVHTWEDRDYLKQERYFRINISPDRRPTLIRSSRTGSEPSLKRSNVE